MRIFKYAGLIGLVGLFNLLAACRNEVPFAPVSVEEAGIKLAEAEAIYDYAYPLVIMKISQDMMFTIPFRDKAWPNKFIHFKNLAGPKNKAVVLGNRNTLYSVGWVDVGAGPVLFEIPDMGERYYVMPLLDAWTNTFQSLGSRTTGQGAQKYVLVGKDWVGDVPAGYEKIVSPTDMVWITGRIQADSAEDAIQAGILQDQYRLIADAEARGDADPFASYKPTFKAIKVRKPVPYSLKLSVEKYYDTFFQMWADNPSPPADADMLALIARAGITSDTRSFSELSAAVQTQLKVGLKNKQAAYLKAFYDGTNQTGPWAFNLDPNMGDWGTSFSRRAYWGMWGLGTNIAKDAVYGVSQLDADMNALNGQTTYRIHFEAGATPPTNAFWSVTNYDADGYLEANEYDRYALGSNHDLEYNADGSLDFYLSHKKPRGKNLNWVPAPKDDFKVLLRIYWPKQSVLDEEWELPPIERIEGG